MELALTLLSIASFFGLIGAWALLPASQYGAATLAAPTTSPQVAS